MLRDSNPGRHVFLGPTFVFVGIIDIDSPMVQRVSQRMAASASKLAKAACACPHESFLKCLDFVRVNQCTMFPDFVSMPHVILSLAFAPVEIGAVEVPTLKGAALRMAAPLPKAAKAARACAHDPSLDAECFVQGSHGSGAIPWLLPPGVVPIRNRGKKEGRGATDAPCCGFPLSQAFSCSARITDGR